MFVKICGMTSREAIEAAVAAGADAIGFVFAVSPRRVTPEQAVELSAGLPPRVLRVAVMRHPPAALWQRVLRVFAPDWLQSDAEDFAALVLPPGCTALPVYRDGAIEPGDRPPRLLFESGVSGSGRAADWDQARALARRSELILAGGLDAANIERAIDRVRPWGVDVSSGVEQRRGHKDPVKIRDFVARVRALEGVERGHAAAHRAQEDDAC